jgi:hypothetical protein
MDLENEIVCERAIKTRMDFKNKIEKKEEKYYEKNKNKKENKLKK